MLTGLGLHLDYEFRPGPAIRSIFFHSVPAGFIIIAVEFGWPLEPGTRFDLSYLALTLNFGHLPDTTSTLLLTHAKQSSNRLR